MSNNDYDIFGELGDELDDDREDSGSIRRKLMGLGADVVNRALITGVSAVFMTEEGIRGAVSDLRLPKDVARGLVQHADATKTEMFRILGREVRTFLEASNLSTAIANALAETTVEIRTQITFRPNDVGEITPEVTHQYEATSPVTEMVADEDAGDTEDVENEDLDSTE